MSLTITGIIIAALSLVFSPEEAQALTTAAGILISYIGRVRIGDIHWYGVRK